MRTILRLANISKEFNLGAERLSVLQNINLTINYGDYLAIMGTSGSGKSTLLNIIGCLDRPSSGEIYLDDINLAAAKEQQLAAIRAKRIAFVFQSFHLLPHLSTLRNVQLPFLYSALSPQEIKEQSEAALERVGMSHRLNHKPAELSGGEMQRVAIARALAVQPEIILADEPTGSLDSKTGHKILDLFASFHDLGVTIIMVTHDRAVACRTKGIVHIEDGQLVVADD